MSTSTSSFGSVSFQNIFGILLSIVLCVLFLMLGGHTLKYIKEFAVKIKIIVNRAADKTVGLKDFNYKPRETIQNNPSYNKWESIFKNEIKRSRSLQYHVILGNYLQKYDFVLYYPFRDRTSEKFNLLRPKPSFHVLILVTACCVVWMTTIFISSIVQQIQNDISSLSFPLLIGISAAIAVVSSIFNIICINRLYRIYVLNVKGAFKVDYGKEFVDIQQRIEDYRPENTIEEEEFLRAQEEKLDHFNTQHAMNGPTQKTVFREDTNINSTRKLLGEDFEKSEYKDSLRRSLPVVEEVKEDDFQGMGFNNSRISQNTEKKKGKALKEVFDLQVPIDGLNEADSEEKFIFVEDIHAIGDTDLLDNEAMKGENKSNVTTFAILFMAITCGMAICCYLNYQFPALLAEYVFYMFIGAFLADFLITRVLILMLIALIKYCKGCAKGYRKLKYKSSKEVKNLLGQAIKAMFDGKNTLKEQRQHRKDKNFSDIGSNQGNNSRVEQNTSRNGGHNSDKEKEESFHREKLMNIFTSMQNLDDKYNQDKEDQFAREVEDKRDDDLDGNKIYNNDIKDQFGGLGKNNNKNPFENTQKTEAYHSNTPLISNLQKALQDKEDEQYDNLMDKKQLSNELVDYNLLLLRKIYDAYEERADKVLNNFRSDKNQVLRKRYMVPIINPNYDYEKLLEEFKQQGKAKENGEEEVHLDGETVCEDFEKDLMEAIQEEATDDLVDKKIEREKIDKYGQSLDEEKQKRKNDYDALKRRLANGEQLSEEDLAYLWELEEERLRQINERIADLMSKGLNNLTDEERIELFDLDIEKLTIEQSRLKRKKSLTDDEKLRLEEIDYEIKKIELEKLKFLQKIGRLSEKDKLRLEQLQEELSELELEELMQKLRNGELTEEETKRLLQLLKKHGISLTDEEKKKLWDAMKKFGLLSEQELEDELFDELMKKFQNGTINADELKKLKELMEKRGIKLTEEDMKKMKDYERQFGMMSEEDKDMERFEYLRGRLMDGTITEEELLELLKLLEKYGINLNDEEKQKIKESKKRLGMQSQEEKDQDLIEELLKKLKDGTITEEELRKLMELQKKYNLQLSDDELKKMLELQKKFDMLDEDQERQWLNELKDKLMDDSINKEELIQLIKLIDKIDEQLTKQEEEKLYEARKKFGLLDENEKENEQLKELLKKLRELDLTKDGLKTLMELIDKNNLKLSEEDNEKLYELRKKYDMLSKEEQDQELLHELFKKLDDDSINKNELLQLLQLIEDYDVNLTKQQEQQLYNARKKFGLLTQEELDLEELNELREKLRNGNITEEELRRLLELQNKYGVNLTDDEIDKIREVEDKLNQLDQSDRQEKEENFKELPEVMVMSKPGTAQSLRQRINEKEKQDETTKQIQQQEEEQQRVMSRQSQRSQHDVKTTTRVKSSESQKRKQQEEEEWERERQKELQKQRELEEQERQNEIQRLKEEEIQREKELERLKEQEEFANQELVRQQEMERQKEQERLDELERQKEHTRQLEKELERQQKEREKELERQRELAKQQEDNEQAQEKLRELERQAEIERQKALQKQEELERQQQELQKEIERQKELERQQENERQQELERQKLMSQERQRDLERQKLLSQEKQRELEQQRLLSQERQREEERQRLLSQERQRLLSQEQQRQVASRDSIRQKCAKEESIKKSQIDDSFNDLDMFKEEQAIGEGNMAPQQQQLLKQSMNEMTPKGSNLSKTQQHFNQPLMKDLDNEDLNNILSARDELDNNQEESIYSHKTTTILDEEKVSFMHIEHLPNQDNGSEDSFDEQDMVYYNKDDLTNYSKGLGLNKVKAKPLPQQKQKYFSENDLVEESESENEQIMGHHRQNRARSQLSNEEGYSSGEERKRQAMGRGHLNHHDQMPIDDYSDLIDGRHKVDSWNVNYKNKKKKHKKKKLTKDQLKKMDDIKDIYGIDAKTLAGLSNGRLPRKLLASGKFKKEGHPHDYQTENSMGSTQNTFANKHHFSGDKRGERDPHNMQSINDNQSNLFSFNGYGTSKRWNDIQSTLKGEPFRQSGMDVISEFKNEGRSKGNINKKQQQPGGRKLTKTQQKFGQSPRDNYPEEESKSYNNSSAKKKPNIDQRLDRKFQSQYSNYQDQPYSYSNQMQNQMNRGNQPFSNNFNNKPATKKQPHKRNSNQSQSDRIDSHSESDEAVDDRGAIFQRGFDNSIDKRNPANYVGGMNDELNHSESDEGLNNEQPNFDGNEFMFKKRAPGAKSSMIPNNQQNNKKNNNNIHSKGGLRSGSQSSGKLEIEDLEAQQISNKKGNKFGNTNKKQANKRFETEDRSDSEEENLGGIVNFQENSRAGFSDTDFNVQNNNRAGMNQFDNERGNSHSSNKRQSQRKASNELRGNSKGNRGHYGSQNEFYSKQSQNKNRGSDHEGSGQKPPISGGKSRRGNNGHRNEVQQRHVQHNNPFNNSERVQPGVFNPQRSASELSDIEMGMRMSGYNMTTEQEEPTDKMQKSKGMNANGYFSNSNSKQRNPQISVNQFSNTKKKMNRTSQSLQDMNDEDQNDYIIGPESDLSMVRQKDFGFGGRGRSNGNNTDDEDRYLLMQRERQIQQDLESSKGETSRLQKKRKIRKAAQSHNNRDLYAKRVEEMQKERLQKMKRQAENALLQHDDDIEKGMKKKKKKVKKDWVKKEINYWLDYDSPYAEYLVARFREWSPNPNGHPHPNNARVRKLNINLKQGASQMGSNRKLQSRKYSDIQNVYAHNASRQGSRQHSTSPEQRIVNNIGNQHRVQQKKGTQQNPLQQQQQRNQQLTHNNNQMFLDDFEEP